MGYFVNFFVLVGILKLCTAVQSCPNGCTCETDEVKCTGSSITSFPNEIPKNTITFYLTYTNVTELPKNAFSNLTLLKNIYIYQNKNLRTLPSGIFNGETLKNLEIVNLNHNSLTTLPENLFNNLPKLHSILLNGNGLLEIPRNTLRNLPKFEFMEVEKNSLTSLPENLFDASLQQRNFYVSFELNQLSSLPDNIFKPIANNLKFLLLSSNEFKILPMNALRILGDQFDEIKVRRNPVFCNCSLAEFALWAKNLMHESGVTCNGLKIALDQINLTHCVLPTTTLPTTASSTTTTKEQTTELPTSTKRVATRQENSTAKTPVMTEKQTSTPEPKISLATKVLSTIKLPSSTKSARDSAAEPSAFSRTPTKSNSLSSLLSTRSNVPNTGDPETQDTSDKNEKRKTVIIAVSVVIVACVILTSVIMCLFHTGILSPRCGLRFRKQKVVIYDAEGNVLVTEKTG